VHRSQYPEDADLRAAGATLGRPPVARPVIVGMTTTPTRARHAEPAIRSLLNQSQPACVIVSVPNVYNSRRSHWNGKRIDLPPWLAALDAAARRSEGPCAPCALAVRTPADYGPATKLVGAVAALRTDETLAALAGAGDPADVVVVAADDDHEWEPFALATLLAVGLGDAPAGRRGARYDAASAVWTYYAYPYPRKPLAEAPPVCVAQAGDMLAAPLPVLAGLGEWAPELLPGAGRRPRRAPRDGERASAPIAGGRLPNCFFVDDLFFAAYLASRRARVYTHPWKKWLFREAKRREASGAAAFRPCARGGCSPVTIRLRYPDGLAMGEVRENHNENCLAQLRGLGWWPAPAPGAPAPKSADLCRMGDF